MSKQEKGIKMVSRREFLQKSALVGAGVAATGVLASCAPKSAGATGKSQTWDKEVDVLVVGSGTATLAAMAAKDAGAESVLIVEKGQIFGGTSALSGGGFWLPVNYAMKEAGLEDNREDAYKYLSAATFGQSTEELINTYLDNAPALIEWLRDKFGYTWSIGNSQYNDYYQLPGYRPLGRTVYPIADSKSMGGMGFWQSLQKVCQSLGIEILLETAGKQLITSDNGEVIGLVAVDVNGKELRIHAKKGVILGTGGFDFNKEMTSGYLRGPIYASNAVKTNTGDGHLMAMALGADLRNMNESWGLPFFPLDEEKMQGEADWQIYRGKPNAIVVNKYGERIGNEASSYELFQRSFYHWDSGKFEWRNLPAYWICDTTFVENYFMPGSNYQMGVVPEWITKADTLEDLCKQLGIDYAGFEPMLSAFNANALEGVDPVWHRGEYDFDKGTAGDMSTNRPDLKNNCLAPLEKGPFYGAKYVPGTCGTSGGLRINANAQVLNVWGEPIKRLYAVGNTSGSVMGAGYPGGGSTLGAGGVFGMLAGRHAAALETAA